MVLARKRGANTLIHTINESINIKLESIQYNAALAITGAIKGTSRSKLYKKIGLGKSRGTLRCLCAFHKIESTCLPTYLLNLIPQSTHTYQIRTSDTSNFRLPTYQYRTDTFRHSFFPWTAIEWNRIHPGIKNASITVFKKYLLKEIRYLQYLQTYSTKTTN